MLLFNKIISLAQYEDYLETLQKQTRTKKIRTPY